MARVRRATVNTFNVEKVLSVLRSKAGRNISLKREREFFLSLLSWESGNEIKIKNNRGGEVFRQESSSVVTSRLKIDFISKVLIELCHARDDLRLMLCGGLEIAQCNEARLIRLWETVGWE